MNTYLHMQPEDGGGFLLAREGGISEPRFLVMTGMDGVRLNLKEALSFERALSRWINSFDNETALTVDSVGPE